MLKEGGADYDTVLKTTVYLQNMSDFASVNSIYATYFKTDCPARSCFAVGALPMGGLVEIAGGFAGRWIVKTVPNSALMGNMALKNIYRHMSFI